MFRIVLSRTYRLMKHNLDAYKARIYELCDDVADKNACISRMHTRIIDFQRQNTDLTVEKLTERDELDAFTTLSVRPRPSKHEVTGLRHQLLRMHEILHIYDKRLVAAERRITELEDTIASMNTHYDRSCRVV